MGAEVTLGWILSSEPSELLFPRRKFPVFKDNGHTLHPTTFVSLGPLPNSPRARPTASLSWPGLPEYLKRARETKKILRTFVTVTDSVPLLTLNRASHGEEPPHPGVRCQSTWACTGDLMLLRMFHVYPH